MSAEKMFTHNLSSQREFVLRAEKIRAEGRHDAFQFALECHGDPARIQSEIAYYEAELSSAKATAHDKPLAPNTSVRLHIEGYLVGLKDALWLLSQTDEPSGNVNQPAPTLAA